MIRAVHKIQNAFLFARRVGMREFIRELNYRVNNLYQDWRLGVHTAGMMKLEELGFSDEDLFDYVPLGYRDIWSALDEIPLDKSLCTFLDYGCGKGRAIVAAATLPYRRVIGVEISGRLFATAKKNVEVMKRRRAKSIELYNVDAIEYVVPDDVNIVYFFNPFKGIVLQQVINNLHDSYKRCQREIYIVFFNKPYFEKTVSKLNWIARISQSSVYPNYSCGIYVTRKPYDLHITSQ